MKSVLFCWIVVCASLRAFSQAIPSNVYAYNRAPVVNHSGYQERTLLEGTTRDYSHLLVQAITLPPNQPGQPVQQLDEEAMVIIKTGELTLTLGSKRKTLKPGSLVMIMPGDEYRLENKAAQPLTYYQILYTSNEMPDLDLYQLIGGSYWIDKQDISSTTNHTDSVHQKGAYPSVMSTRIAIQVTKLAPNPEPHRLPRHRAAELIFILDHPIQAQIDGALKEATAGDLIFVESEVAHDIQTNSQEGSTYLSFQF